MSLMHLVTHKSFMREKIPSEFLSDVRCAAADVEIAIPLFGWDDDDITSSSREKYARASTFFSTSSSLKYAQTTLFVAMK